MQAPLFLQKFGRDIVYITIIGCMAGWIGVNKKRASEWNQILCPTMEQSIQHMDKQNEFTTYLIKRLNDSYTCEYNEKWNVRAIDAQKSVLDFRAQLDEALLGLGSDSIKTTRLFQTLRISAQNLCDALSINIDKDSLSTTTLKALLEQEPSSQFWTLAKCSDQSQASVALKVLSQNSALAFALVLEYLNQRVSGNDDFRFDSYEPLASADSAAIYVGGTYHADIFLAPYSSITRNLRVQVNQQPLPFCNGLAHFSQRYSTPGEKKYTVKMELKNPLTGETRVFMKEFGLIVVDSCQ